MHRRQETRYSPRGGYAGAEEGDAPQQAAPQPNPQPAPAPKRKLAWGQIFATALITGIGFYVGTSLLKKFEEKGSEETEGDLRRQMLLHGIPAPQSPALAMHAAPVAQPATIQAAPGSDMIMITPQALARLQAGKL